MKYPPDIGTPSEIIRPENTRSHKTPMGYPVLIIAFVAGGVFVYCVRLVCIGIYNATK
jgi:hypothetical protein